MTIRQFHDALQGLFGAVLVVSVLLGLALLLLRYPLSEPEDIHLHRSQWYCTKSELAGPATRCIEYVRASGGTR